MNALGTTKMKRKTRTHDERCSGQKKSHNAKEEVEHSLSGECGSWICPSSAPNISPKLSSSKENKNSFCLRKTIATVLLDGFWRRQKKCPLWESNPGPSAYKAGALPTELKRLCLGIAYLSEKKHDRQQTPLITQKTQHYIQRVPSSHIPSSTY